MLFGAVSAGLYVVFAFIPLTYATLLVAVTLLTASFLFVASAQNALTSMIGQQHAMSGQISAAWNIFLSVPTVVALLIGGHLSNRLEDRNADQAARILFLGGAALWPRWPSTQFEAQSVRQHPRRRRCRRPALERSQKAVRHWPIYPALLICCCWNLAPGSATPLQYYLQNTPARRGCPVGSWNAIFAASFVPTFLVFGVLCQRLPLRTLLLWDGRCNSTDGSVASSFILVTGALISAVPSADGGVATAAYMDLIIRSCPRGLRARP